MLTEKTTTEYKQGDLVRYHPVIGEPHDGKVYQVRAVGKLGHGETVVWLAGKAGCVTPLALTMESPK